MSKPTYTLVVTDAGRPEVPIPHRLRSWLKSGLRTHSIRCVRCQEGDLSAEVARLQGIIKGLADRVATQSELLSRRAEGHGSGNAPSPPGRAEAPQGDPEANRC